MEKFRHARVLSPETLRVGLAVCAWRQRRHPGRDNLVWKLARVLAGRHRKTCSTRMTRASRPRTTSWSSTRSAFHHAEEPREPHVRDAGCSSPKPIRSRAGW
jgi:hypothetical protein